MVFSFASGALAPTFSIILGTMVKIFDPKISKEESREIMLDWLPIIVGLVLATFLAAYLGYALM